MTSRGSVVEQPHDGEAVLAVDETSDLTTGVPTVGVQRQYADTAGRTENSQPAVHLACSTGAPRGGRPGTVRSESLDPGCGPLPGRPSRHVRARGSPRPEAPPGPLPPVTPTPHAG
ncbi:transposase [Streptomyces sp. TRM 70361]|uniref:transposase n=1 Tax=Streptomyces sp. TRM 70361 TaxID=3116553 RepID=UPI002E7BDE9E|nr:transposase [Streptomyces sp. TRM 70361]MEE1943105.1 transposase [Streptomyces sp. TRM 70361]